MSSARQPFEDAPYDGPHDETDAALRAHFDRMADEKAAEYDPAWTDDELMAWDGEFRSDGCLMLVCCDRDVEAAEYRRVLEEYLRFRRFGS